MRAAIYRPAHGHGQRAVRAFYDGLARHGHDYEIMHDGSLPNPGHDLVVMWGASRRNIINHCEFIGLYYIIVELGYLGDRFKHNAICIDGLHGRSMNYAEGHDSERFDLLELEPLDYKRNGPSLDGLIMGQCKGDAATRHVDLSKWYSDAAREMRDNGFHPYFRPHPNSNIQGAPFGIDLARWDKLEKLFALNPLVVTFNSNAGVDAALHGCHTVATDFGSMVWPISMRTASSEIHYRLGREEKRNQLLYDMAWRQWTNRELKNGKCWEYLRCHMYTN